MKVIKKLDQRALEFFKYRQQHWKKSIGDAMEERFGISSNNEANFSEGVGSRSVKNAAENHNDVRLSRNLPEGNCKLDDFQDGVAHFCPDAQKVFLGGLPRSITAWKLVCELEKKGYKVINEPKITQGFSSEICLGSVVEAQEMVQMGTIMIDGCTVDVKVVTQKEVDSQLDLDRRSVLLKGLPPATTFRAVRTEIEKLGLRVTNPPGMKTGHILKVTLATVYHAKQLIAYGAIDLNGVSVNVLPYKQDKN